MGRKVGDLIQYIAQVIGCFVVGFYLCWRLTVVLLAAIPLVAVSGIIIIIIIIIIVIVIIIIIDVIINKC